MATKSNGKPKRGFRTRAAKKKPSTQHKKDGTPRAKPKRPTRKQFNDMLDRAGELLQAGNRDGQIRKIISKEYKIPRDTAARYVTRARKIILEEIGLPKEEHQANSYTFYCGIVADDDESTHDRLAAQKRIDKLLGLEAVMRLNIDGKIDVDHRHMHLVSMVDLDVVLKELNIDGLVVKRKLLERLRERSTDKQTE